MECRRYPSAPPPFHPPAMAAHPLLMPELIFHCLGYASNDMFHLIPLSQTRRSWRDAAVALPCTLRIAASVEVHAFEEVVLRLLRPWGNVRSLDLSNAPLKGPEALQALLLSAAPPGGAALHVTRFPRALLHSIAANGGAEGLKAAAGTEAPAPWAFLTGESRRALRRQCRFVETCFYRPLIPIMAREPDLEHEVTELVCDMGCVPRPDGVFQSVLGLSRAERRALFLNALLTNEVLVKDVLEQWPSEGHLAVPSEVICGAVQLSACVALHRLKPVADDVRHVLEALPACVLPRAHGLLACRGYVAAGGKDYELGPDPVGAPDAHPDEEPSGFDRRVWQITMMVRPKGPPALFPFLFDGRLWGEMPHSAAFGESATCCGPEWERLLGDAEASARALLKAVGAAFARNAHDVAPLADQFWRALHEGHPLLPAYCRDDAAVLCHKLATWPALVTPAAVDVTLCCLVKEALTRCSERRAFMRAVLHPGHARLSWQERWRLGIQRAWRARDDSYGHACWRNAVRDLGPAGDAFFCLQVGLAAAHYGGDPRWPEVTSEGLDGVGRQGIREEEQAEWVQISIQYGKTLDLIDRRHETPEERERRIFHPAASEGGAVYKFDDDALDLDDESAMSVPDMMEEDAVTGGRPGPVLV